MPLGQICAASTVCAALALVLLAIPVAPAVGQDDGAQLLELAGRLLASPAGGPSGTQEMVQLLPGRLAAELPFDFPIPAGARLLGSLVRASSFNGTNVEVVLDAPGSAEEIKAFYDEAIPALGWNPPPSGAPGVFAPGSFSPGGFQAPGQASRLQPRSSTFCEGPNGAFLTITANPKANGPTDVRASLRMPPSPLTGAGFGACATFGSVPPPGSGNIAKGPDLIPHLTVPAEASLDQPGNASLVGAGVSAYRSEAAITTDMSPPALESFFADQLGAQGWTRLSEGAHDLLAWSIWRLPEEDEWQGTLIVMRDSSDDRRSLSIRVDSPRPLGVGQTSNDALLPPPPIDPELTADPNLIRELAQRLLAQPSGSATSNPSAVQILVGQLAPDIPSDLPMPGGTRVLGSLVRSPDAQAYGNEAVLDIPNSPREALQFFLDALSRAGWEPSPSAALGGPSGFVSSTGPFSLAVCQEETLRHLNFILRPAAGGGTDARVTTTSGALGSDTCWPATSVPDFRPSSFASPGVTIPPLVAAPGAQVELGMHSTGGTSAGYDGAIISGQSTPELEANLSQQLHEAGWTRRASAAAAPLAWSAWDVPGEETWRGFLLVFDAPGEGRHAVSLSVQRVD